MTPASQARLSGSAATLFVIATPLGNLGDITVRIRECLTTVPVVACEDTRVTHKLLAHLGASPRLLSVREANEESGAEAVLRYLTDGQSVAYCSDAGTPGVSDPGCVLVGRVRAAGYRVEALPGPSAVATALALSALPADRFYFAGFLPAKKKDRLRELDEVAGLACTLVFYEAPHRMNAFLADALQVLGSRDVVVCRELTKRFEEVIAGRLGEIAEQARLEREWKGELTIVVAGCGTEGRGDEGPGESLDQWLARRLGEDATIRPRELAREAARVFAISGSDAYRAVIAARGTDGTAAERWAGDGGAE